MRAPVLPRQCGWVTNPLTIRPERLRRLRQLCLALPEATEKWDEVRELVEDSYRLIAPTRLAARLDQD